jgi:hypothetical protein
MSMFVGGHTKHTQFVICGCEMVLYNAPTIKISITKHSHVEVEKKHRPPSFLQSSPIRSSIKP